MVNDEQVNTTTSSKVGKKMEDGGMTAQNSHTSQRQVVCHPRLAFFSLHLAAQNVVRPSRWLVFRLEIFLFDHARSGSTPDMAQHVVPSSCSSFTTGCSVDRSRSGEHLHPHPSSTSKMPHSEGVADLQPWRHTLEKRLSRACDIVILPKKGREKGEITMSDKKKPEQIQEPVRSA